MKFSTTHEQMMIEIGHFTGDSASDVVLVGCLRAPLDASRCGCGCCCCWRRRRSRQLKLVRDAASKLGRAHSPDASQPVGQSASYSNLLSGPICFSAPTASRASRPKSARAHCVRDVRPNCADMKTRSCFSLYIYKYNSACSSKINAHHQYILT